MAESKEAMFPMDEETHLPQDALQAAQSVSDSDSNSLKLSWGNQIEIPKEKAIRCREATEKWGNLSRKCNGGPKEN